MSGVDLAARILVVEDDEDIAYLLRFVLEREGFNVEVAADGRAAEACLKEKSPPDAVVLDIMLPHIDGFELLDMMRASDTWRNVPVLVLTAKAREDDIVRALDGGANDYVLKPFQPQEVLARLRRTMQARS